MICDRFELHTHPPSDDYGQFSQPEPGEGGRVRRGEIMALPAMLEQLHARLSIAPGFRDVPGLIRKQFIYAEDRWVGGVYLWQTRAAAGAFYTGPRLDGIRERYGMDPQIKYFETACITDNAIEAIVLPDPTR